MTLRNHGRPAVVMRGAYGEGNFGDDALMLTTHSILSQVLEPEDIAVALGANAATEAAAHATSLLPGARFVPYRAGAGSRLVVWGGGTQWCSFPHAASRPSLSTRVARRLRDPLSAAAYAGRLLSERLHPALASAALGVGIGPFADAEREQASAQELRAANFVAVRDDVSSRYCDRWGIDDVILGADLCFAGDRWRRPPQPRPSPHAAKASVGVIIRDWAHDAAGAAYDGPLIRAVAALRAAGHTVDFISFSARGDAQWLNSLRQADEAVLAWNAAAASLDDFLQAHTRYDCLVSSRYHGTIFGALNATPVISVDVEPKLRVAAETVHGRLWRRPFAERELLDLIAAATADPAAEAARTADAVSRQVERAGVMVSRFLEFVVACMPEAAVGRGPARPHDELALAGPPCDSRG